MKRALVIISLLFVMAVSSAAQEVKVSPASVNAYSQGATSVFLTFSGVIDKRAVEACWCGDIVPAAPDIGFRCNPATVFGCLPIRYDQSRLNSNGVYTDIMSIPPSVARRAYIDAAGGAEATFFYVRRFVSTVGGLDEFVPVAIRLSGNGAAAPFSITNVKLSWGVDKPVLIVESGEKLPPVTAEITYTGSGQLKGRWEIVKPGEETPSVRDLLTESSLPPEERASQRRYTQLSRFNLFLPPTGKYILPGPEVWRVPSHIVGPYLLLLRIEATDDVQANSDPAAGTDTGAVAGFPLPVLRYYVGSDGDPSPVDRAKAKLALLLPADQAIVSRDALLDFSWTEVEGAAFYRLEVEGAQGERVLSAVLLPGVATYRAPPWLKEKAGDGNLRWQVVVFDQAGNRIGETPKRNLRLADQQTVIKRE